MKKHWNKSNRLNNNNNNSCSIDLQSTNISGNNKNSLLPPEMLNGVNYAIILDYLEKFDQYLLEKKMKITTLERTLLDSTKGDEIIFCAL
jgi:hypothetical protein